MRTLLFLLAFALAARAQMHPSLPEPGTLDGLGVNIHFTEPQPGELEMIRAAGFRWVRMDFSWAATEPQPGRYDFAKYDSLLAALEKAGLRAYFILDYGHPRFGKQAGGNAEADLIRKAGRQEKEGRAAAGASVPDFLPSLEQHPFTSRAGTPEFRDAFAKWAVAAVGHFKGRGIVWELWNEPNIAGFWKPKPDVQHYIALAKTVAAALEKAGLRTKSRNFPPGTKREAAGECLVGPATSVIDLPFLDACFAAGLLEVFDAISVHPYRQGAPESVAEEYRALRLLIRRHCAADALPLGTFDPSRPNPARRIPILSGEWGWSAAWPSLGKDEAAREATQAKYLPRMFLTNVSNDIPLSIWYDWRDDGDDPKEAEHRFGIVRRKPTGDAKQPFEPKPAYTAMKVMCEELKGMKFSKELAMPDFAHTMLFSSEERGACLAGFLPFKPYAPGLNDIGEFQIRTLFGNTVEGLDALGKSDDVRNHPDALLYLHSTAVAPRLAMILSWERMPLEYSLGLPTILAVPFAVENHSSEAVRIMPNSEWSDGHVTPWCAAESWKPATADTFWGFDVEPKRRHRAIFPVLLSSNSSEGFIAQTLFSLQKVGSVLPENWPSQRSAITRQNTIGVAFLPRTPEGVFAIVISPHGSDFRGRWHLELMNAAGGSHSAKGMVNISGAKREQVISLIPSAKTEVSPSRIGSSPLERQLESQNVSISDESGNVIRFIRSPAASPGTLQAAMLHVISDGDAAVASTQSLTDGQPAEGASVSGTPSVGLRYRFGAGWKFVRIEPKDAAARKIEGGPRAFGIWVHGDGQGGTPCIRLRDATGQVLQVRGEPVSWKGWRYVTFPLRPAADSGQTMIPLPDAGAEQRVSWGHWGGANDGEVHFPIEWDTIFLLDGNGKAMEGEIFLSAPTLVY